MGINSFTENIQSSFSSTSTLHRLISSSSMADNRPKRREARNELAPRGAKRNAGKTREFSLAPAGRQTARASRAAEFRTQ
jgi:hypothetical protein